MKMKTDKITKKDGRYLIYYNFKDSSGDKENKEKNDAKKLLTKSSK